MVKGYQNEKPPAPSPSLSPFRLQGGRKDDEKLKIIDVKTVISLSRGQFYVTSYVNADGRS